MARNLTFALGGREYAATPLKIERKKLYGWTETIALDDDGNECRLVSMDETGTVIIPKGGVGLGIVSPELEWVDRGSLKVVSLDGGEAQLIKSSYDTTIALSQTATPEEFLDCAITAFYQIPDADPELIAAAREKLFTFDYIYRDGYETQRAFLVENEGALFMMLGYKAELEMLSLDEAGVIEEEPEEAEEEESDEIDFSMF